MLRAAIMAAMTVTGGAALADGAAPLELVMFEQTYCEWCERWDEEIGVVYARTEEGRAAPLRRVDIHADRPEDLEDVEGVVFTPTFVLMEDGTELGRIAGYPGEDFFWPMLGQLLEKRAGER